MRRVIATIARNIEYIRISIQTWGSDGDMEKENGIDNSAALINKIFQKDGWQIVTFRRKKFGGAYLETSFVAPLSLLLFNSK